MSLIAWLDASAEEQRRIREIVALFADKGTLDELGIGQIRDAFSDALFPGTSTIQTRARYFLFVPWAFQQGAETGPSHTVRHRAQMNERRIIEPLRRDGSVEGLIGRQAGAKVKNLPSAIYWSGLTRFQILNRPLSQEQVGIRPGPDMEAEELAGRLIGDWNPTMPARPSNFLTNPGGLELTHEEARWLQERILMSVPGSLLAHLVERDVTPDPATPFPWRDPATRSTDSELNGLLEHARLFSLAMEGASLLYNLLVAEKYEEAGHTKIVEPRADYSETLADWEREIQEEKSSFENWRRDELWHVAYRLAPQIALPTRLFVDRWIDLAGVDSRHRPLSEDHELRALVSEREQFKKGNQSRLTNERRLGSWLGSSGRQAFTYRWPTVKTLVTDIHEGLRRASR